jgi:transcription antitermination protein NusB
MSKGLIQLSRELLVQAIYQHLITETLEDDLLCEFKEKIATVNKAHFKRVLGYFFSNRSALEESIAIAAARPMRKIDLIDQSILFIAISESQCCTTPVKVIINEAIELARIYGPEDSYRFINGALDKLKITKSETIN